MTDIVERLRIEISEDRLGAPIDVMKEAADEIVRLRTNLALLTAFSAKLDDIQSELITVHERIRKLGI